MSLYAIGDLHMSLGNPEKSMEFFGGRWLDYHNKIESGFSELYPEDTTVLCGDISWGMDFDSSLPDFKFIDALPGRKIILKGNHDYWWNTVTKTKRFFEENTFLPKYHRTTSRLTAFIIDLLTDERSFTSVAKEFNLSLPTVIRIFDLVQYPRPNTLPRTLAIDEFKGNTGGQKFNCIIS